MAMSAACKADLSAQLLGLVYPLGVILLFGSAVFPLGKAQALRHGQGGVFRCVMIVHIRPDSRLKTVFLRDFEDFFNMLGKNFDAITNAVQLSELT